jgi:hypothetical protein
MNNAPTIILTHDALEAVIQPHADHAHHRRA